MKNDLLIIKNITPEVILITLNRPDKRNALNIELIEQLCFTFDELKQKSNHRVAILNGNGPVFCAGLDLVQATDPLLEEKSALLIARLLTAIYSAPFVTIAAIHGAALAGGAGIMTACDLAIAANNTKIGFPEVRRGLVAAQVAVFLRKQIHMRGVRELLLLGEIIDADHALTLGLINRSVKEDDLLSEALKMAEHVLKCAPNAIKETKRLLENLDALHFSQDLEIALTFHHTARQSHEAKEGVKAFFDKRLPYWDKELNQI